MPPPTQMVCSGGIGWSSASSSSVTTCLLCSSLKPGFRRQGTAGRRLLSIVRPGRVEGVTLVDLGDSGAEDRFNASPAGAPGWSRPSPRESKPLSATAAQAED